MFDSGAIWTWNEASKQVQQIPDLPHLREVSRQWFETSLRGQPLIIEKSRRIVVSWCLRACELWALGRGREDHILGGLTYQKGAAHTWRIVHLYREMLSRRSEWDLAPIDKGVKVYGSEADRQVDSVIFENLSRVTRFNQESDAIQGDGYSRVTLEEFSLYRRCEALWAQGLLCLQGEGTTRGHLVAVANASPNAQWQRVKKVKK